MHERLAIRSDLAGMITALAFSPDGIRFLTAGRSCSLWDLETRREVARLPSPTEPVVRCGFLDEDSLVIAGRHQALLITAR